MDNRIKNLQIAAEFQNLKWSIRRASEYVEDTLKTDHAKMPPPPTTMKLTRGKRKSPERTPESTPTIPKVLRISGRELHDAKRLALQRAKTRREAEPTQVIDWAPFVNTVVSQEPKPASPFSLAAHVIGGVWWEMTLPTLFGRKSLFHKHLQEIIIRASCHALLLFPESSFVSD
ncbi:hypothetical protein PROFUN_15442 [Planoprotostelium fungivorum]|uniref:Uncharacterized protein n=1 Tax=Planoprotostelium fungivorum TaxID=1890364 RepID=A0A2P6MWQ2_9EUKA|nr:hypothetical protein PROFUN_15442 [Planoprotostelium fungivorum]